MKSFFDPMVGASLQFPDDVDDNTIQRATMGLRQQVASQQQMQQQPQNGFLGFIGQTLTEALQPQPQMYAQVEPAAGYAMTQPMMQTVLQTQQSALNQNRAVVARERESAAQRAQQNAIQQQRERMQMKQLIQQEKDAADRLKLQKMMHDNEVEMQRQREEAAQERAKQAQEFKEAEAERKASQPKLDMTRGIQWNLVDGNYIPSVASPELYQEKVLNNGAGRSSGGGSGGGGGVRRAGGGGGGAAQVDEKGTVTIGGKKFSPKDRYQTWFSDEEGNLYTRDEMAGLIQSSKEMEEKATLEDISRGGSRDNDNRTRFVNEARAAGHSDEEIQKYIDNEKIYDDNSFWNPFSWGKQPTVSDIRRPIAPPTEEEMKRLTPEEIAALRAAGRLK